MTDYRVRMSDRFLEAAIMGAIEAYCHGDGNQTEIETIGPIWGHRRENGDEHVIFLDRLAVSLSAERDTKSVTPKAEATQLMAEVMDRLAPELTLLGDFHSHPYKDRTEVDRNKGFEFSPGDFNAFLGDDDLWSRNLMGPVMMVVTICRLSRVHDTAGKPIRNNIWQFDLGQFRFWINVCIGFLDDDGERQHTGNKRSKVWLDLNSRFFNDKGDRVGD
jgi:hypothetical protein